MSADEEHMDQVAVLFDAKILVQFSTTILFASKLRLPRDFCAVGRNVQVCVLPRDSTCAGFEFAVHSGA